MIPTFRPWTHTSDDSYIYQLSLVVATATVSSCSYGAVGWGAIWNRTVRCGSVKKSVKPARHRARTVANYLMLVKAFSLFLFWWESKGAVQSRLHSLSSYGAVRCGNVVFEDPVVRCGAIRYGAIRWACVHRKNRTVRCDSANRHGTTPHRRKKNEPWWKAVGFLILIFSCCLFFSPFFILCFSSRCSFYFPFC